MRVEVLLHRHVDDAHAELRVEQVRSQPQTLAELAAGVALVVTVIAVIVAVVADEPECLGERERLSFDGAQSGLEGVLRRATRELRVAALERGAQHVFRVGADQVVERRRGC